MPYRKRFGTRIRRRSGYGRARRFKRRMRRRSRMARMPNLNLTPLRQTFKCVTRQIVEINDQNGQFHSWAANGRVPQNPSDAQGHLGLEVPKTIYDRFRYCTVLWSKIQARVTYWGYETQNELVTVQCVQVSHVTTRFR